MPTAQKKTPAPVPKVVLVDELMAGKHGYVLPSSVWLDTENLFWIDTSMHVHLTPGPGLYIELTRHDDDRLTMALTERRSIRWQLTAHDSLPRNSNKYERVYTT